MPHLHTTNYQNTFIAVADDCPATCGEIPPTKGDAKSVANQQFDMLSRNPYQFTSDEVLFQVFATRNEISNNEFDEAKQEFFSKGQACFRASPLTKRYGWGVHSDKDGKIAIYGCETDEYKNFANDKNITVVKAMKNSKK